MSFVNYTISLTLSDGSAVLDVLTKIDSDKGELTLNNGVVIERDWIIDFYLVDGESELIEAMLPHRKKKKAAPPKDGLAPTMSNQVRDLVSFSLDELDGQALDQIFKLLENRGDDMREMNLQRIAVALKSQEVQRNVS